MNGQQRNNGSSTAKEQKRIFLEKVETIENYRGCKRILFVRPYSNTYMGYLDDDFFGFTVDQNQLDGWLMDAKKAVDWYLDKTFFHNPVLEYDTFLSKQTYAPNVRLLKMVKEDYDNKIKIK